MISEFSVRPKPQNKKAKIIFLSTLLLAAVIFFVSFYLKKYRGVVGLVALLLLVTSILFYTKYISVGFLYDIMLDSDGVPLFVVRQLIGKRESTLCRVELADIYSCEKETREMRRAHKTPSGYIKYVYTPTFSPSESYRITVKSRYEKCEIIVEGTEEFARIINSYAVEARELRGISLDEGESD